MVENISPRDAATLISTIDIDVIDVREHREWLTGHVAGARLVPLDQFRADPDQVLARDRAVLFICARGVRSLTAAKLAERLGYTRLYNLDGGTQGWTRDGLPLQLDAAIETRAA
jgi:rhodanese-related sulfurtransferase